MSSSADSRPAPAWSAPDLRVVPIDTIWLHENPDPSRSLALIDSIRQQGELENPIVVSSVTADVPGHCSCVHLDGANRLIALRALGCTRVAVQVVDLYQPQQVRLSTWAHRTRVEAVDFLGHLKRLPGADLQPLSREWEATMDPATAAFIFCQQGAYQLSLQKPTLVNRIEMLQMMVAFYGRRIERYKLPLLPEPQVVARHLAPGAPDEPHHVLITFVPLRPEEFLELVSRRVQAPPGMTRFVLHGGRVIGLNVPLALLGPGTCASSADTWLASLRGVQPVIMPGPCRVLDYLGWRDYDDEEPLLVYHPTRRVQTAPDSHRRLAPPARRARAAQLQA
jgi:hypothetical protein